MVEVYRNLHYPNRTWSVKSGRTKRVIARRELVLIKDATLVVRESGRQRVIKEKRKNVHAAVVGTWVRDKETIAQILISAEILKKQNQMKHVTYDPYKHPLFIETATLLPVVVADWVLLDSEGLWVIE